MSKTRKRNFSIEKCQKIGCRSITYVINYDKMDDDAKVSYIRHKYTYYDGSEELFFKSGRANSNRHLLNEIIYQIVTGRILPTILKIINQAIWHWIMQGKKGFIDLKSVLAEHNYIF